MRIVQHKQYLLSFHEYELILSPDFRQTEKPKVLWCDAICINQPDQKERSSQVPLMENVYSNADKVLVWLGKSTESTDRAFQFMDEIVNAPDLDHLVKQKTTGPSWIALEKLMRMPWFTRRWIVQEIALAKDAMVFCGKAALPWFDFCHVVDLFKLYYPEIKNNFLKKKYNFKRNLLGELEALGACQLVDVTNDLFRKSTDGRIERRLMTLESLISGLTMFNAGRELDYVYAMIAISKDIRTEAQNYASVEPDATPVATPTAERISQWPGDEDVSQLVDDDFDETNGIEDTHVQKKRKLRNNMVKVLHQNKLDVPGSRNTDKLHDVIHDVRRQQPFPFPVDYEQSFLKVCRDFVGFAIMRSNSLDVICRPWVPKELKEKYKLPSWLVSVEQYPFQPGVDGAFGRVNGDPFVGSKAIEGKRYSACGSNAQPLRISRHGNTNNKDGWGFCCIDRPSVFHQQETPVIVVDNADTSEVAAIEQAVSVISKNDDHDSLFVTGFVFDTIADIKNPAVVATIPDDWFAFAGWNDKKDLPPDALWRALVADRESDGSHAKAYYRKTLRDIALKECQQGGGLNVSGLLETPRYDKRSEKVLTRILAVVPNRRLFHTRGKTGKLLGLAPSKAEKGHLVCILFGCSVPVILKRHEAIIDGKRHAHYELIGDAYVHGLMEGHAMEDIERSQQFELR